MNDYHKAIYEAEEFMGGPATPPPRRTEAGYPNCATCEGGGCPDCTDPA